MDGLHRFAARVKPFVNSIWFTVTMIIASVGQIYIESLMWVVVVLATLLVLVNLLTENHGKKVRRIYVSIAIIIGCTIVLHIARVFI